MVQIMFEVNGTSQLLNKQSHTANKGWSSSLEVG